MSPKADRCCGSFLFNATHIYWAVLCIRNVSPGVGGRNKRIKTFLSWRNFQFNEPRRTTPPDQIVWLQGVPGIRKRECGEEERRNFHRMYLMND